MNAWEESMIVASRLNALPGSRRPWPELRIDANQRPMAGGEREGRYSFARDHYLGDVPGSGKTGLPWKTLAGR
jgi:hypothetical protein